MHGPSGMFRFAPALALVIAACASGDQARLPPAGTERGTCRANDVCDVGLECWSARCVRPPPAACGEVARRLVGYRVGNYAPPEEIATATVAITTLCQEQQLTAREGRCLLDARGEAELLDCGRVVLPELVARRDARNAPPPPDPIDPALDRDEPPVFPADPWAGSSGYGPCDDYAAVLTAYRQCEHLPLVSRALMGRTLDGFRLQWRTAPASARPQLEAACTAGASGLVDVLRGLGCAP